MEVHMKANDETLPFLFAFTLLFGLFYGMGLLAANLDWTWSRILICLVTVSGVAIAWSLIRKKPLTISLREVGFGIPDWQAMGISVALSVFMLSFFPFYSSLMNVRLPLQNNWPWTLLGIIAGVGIAEETLFRGYVFNFLRRGRTFWKAATLSMILFGAMHLILLLWLPLPIAIAAIILAIIAAYPSAYLFETGNQTIWPPAILHTTALATNLFEIPAELAIPLSLMWIGVVMVGLFLVFVAGKLVPTKLSVVDKPAILEELQAVIKAKK
jgi:membrane protease YdiL (CAAX protease family)